jgi:hypothetical protein
MGDLVHPREDRRGQKTARRGLAGTIRGNTGATGWDRSALPPRRIAAAQGSGRTAEDRESRTGQARLAPRGLPCARSAGGRAACVARGAPPASIRGAWSTGLARLRELGELHAWGDVRGRPVLMALLGQERFTVAPVEIDGRRARSRIARVSDGYVAALAGPHRGTGVCTRTFSFLDRPWCAVHAARGGVIASRGGPNATRESEGLDKGVSYASALCAIPRAQDLARASRDHRRAHHVRGRLPHRGPNAARGGRRAASAGMIVGTSGAARVHA